MKTKRQWIVSFVCALALLANGAGVMAQKTKQEKAEKEAKHATFIYQGGEHQDFTVEGHLVELNQEGAGTVVVGGPPSENTLVFAASEVGFDGKVVKGAPYSAEAVTEHVQTLADGNRIVRKSSAMVFRDSEGRTRREQSVSAIGPHLNVASDMRQTVFINDPVAEMNYVLNTKDRTARKLPRFKFDFKVDAKLKEELEAAKRRKEMEAGDTPKPDELRKRELMEVEEKLKAEHDARVEIISPTGGSFGVMTSGRKRDPRNYRTESLGKQIIEGVEAEGTRAITTIPAGEIGNEFPIEIVNEWWYSPELQTHVMTRRSDPRTGENIYRLVNINRTEPSRSLFEVPADYTIKEEKAGSFMRRKIERN